MNYSQNKGYGGGIVAPSLSYFKNIVNGFFQNDVLRESLIYTDAEELGKELAIQKKDSTSQIRRFYDNLKSIEYKIKASDKPEEEFNRQKPFVLMIISKAAAAKGSKKISPTFENFIVLSLKQVVKEQQSKKAFDAFLKIFETVIGYAVGAGLKN